MEKSPLDVPESKLSEMLKGGEPVIDKVIEDIRSFNTRAGEAVEKLQEELKELEKEGEESVMKKVWNIYLGKYAQKVRLIERIKGKIDVNLALIDYLEVTKKHDRTMAELEKLLEKESE